MSKSTSNFLKIIAMLTMLIDHTGAILFPEYLWLRIIGRISFPLFAYLLVVGFKHTHNVNRYLIRLFIFALISQIPYQYLSPGRFNVILYFFIALLSLKFYDKSNKRFYIPVIVALLTEYLSISYGFYGIVAIYLFYHFYDNKTYISIAFFILNLLYFTAYNSIIQPLSIMALPFLFVNINHLNIKMNKYISYLFYPVHISILLLIKYYNLL